MKRQKFIIGFLILSFIILSLKSQNKPEGFASVEGKGLTTTTGGAGGDTVVVSKLDDLQFYAGKIEPFIIIVRGLIVSMKHAEINIASNKTIVGMGEGATLKNIELHIIDKSNIIIRNLTVRDSYIKGDWDGKTADYDAIQADNTHHLWIDHCHLLRCNDGLIDLRKGCDYVTVSWVHLSNHNKAFGLGWTDDTTWHVTIHHSWFDSTGVRNPSFDQGIGHLYNNYTDNNMGGYGNLARGKARLVIENSFFRNATDPINTINEGKIYASGNEFDNCLRNTTGKLDTMPFKPRLFYEYLLDSVKYVEQIVKSGSGPQVDIGKLYTSSKQVFSVKASISDGKGTVDQESGTYFKGEVLQLIATPDSGYIFDHWSGDISSNTPSIKITIDKSINVSAHFVKNTSSKISSADINKANVVSYYVNNEYKTLNVKFESNELTLNIYSTDGKLLITENYFKAGVMEISLAGYQSGVYIVRFYLNGMIKTGRIILY